MRLIGNHRNTSRVRTVTGRSTLPSSSRWGHIGLGRILAILLIFRMGIIPLNLNASAAPGAIPPILISRSPGGQAGNGWSGEGGISADGRFISFTSLASNLVREDRNGHADIFLHDQKTRSNRRISLGWNGQEANAWSYHPVISASGRFIAFSSVASNLVKGDANGQSDIFVFDQLTGEMEIVSRSSDGSLGNGWSDWPSISANGRFVTFSSSASNLAHGDRNREVDVFLHDRLTRQTLAISRNEEGVTGNGPSGWGAEISGDGIWVAFPSLASNLVSGDENDRQDIFLHNRVTMKTIRLTPPSGEYLKSDWPAISANGGAVAYTALSGPETNHPEERESHLLLFDRETGKTREILHLPGTDFSGAPEMRSRLSPDSAVLFYLAPENGGATLRLQATGTGGNALLDLADRLGEMDLISSGLPATTPDLRQIVYSGLASSEENPVSGVFLLENETSTEKTYRISGRVSDPSGAPLRSVTVRAASNLETMTDRDGYFYLSGVPAGTLNVEIFKEGYQLSPPLMTLDVDRDLEGLGILAHPKKVLVEARADLGMPYSFNRGCDISSEKCYGIFHGYDAGYCTDLVTDAYWWGADFNMQFALDRDALAHPEHFYRWRNVRNSHDMWRYFHYTGQILSDEQPFLPGDIAFFDWEDDGVIDHVSIVSAVDVGGRPEKMLDATGEIANNPGGLAAELDWKPFHTQSSRGHGRWLGSYGAIIPATPPDFQILQIALDSPDTQLRVMDANGALYQIPSSLNGVPSGITDKSRGIEAHWNDLGIEKIFSFPDPFSNTDTYILEISAIQNTRYYLHVQTLQGGKVTRYYAHNGQLIEGGKKRYYAVQLTDVGREISFEIFELE